MSAQPPICPCDADTLPLPTNVPGLTQIAYRAGTFRDFRRELLTAPQNLSTDPPNDPPIEYALTGWRADVNSNPAVADLAVMMVEWWAYLADILTFYNERIANEDYLGTVQLPESAGRLVSVLGYRPRPALGATGTLAALVTPGQTATLPAGLQFQSKPGPGQTPQTYELAAATSIGAPDAVPANPSPPTLVAQNPLSPIDVIMDPRELLHPGQRLEFETKLPGGYLGIGGGNLGGGTIIGFGETIYNVLLQGSLSSLSIGALLMLGPRDGSAGPTLITLSAAPTVQTVVGGKQTQLNFSLTDGTQPLPALTAASALLQRAAQTATLWTVNGSPFSNGNTVVQLAGLARQIRANDWVAFTSPSGSQLVQVSSAQDMMGDASNASDASPTRVSSGTPPPSPIPVLHTQLTVAAALNGAITNNPGAVSILFAWQDVGTLLDQPPGPWDGRQPALAPVQPAVFAAGNTVPIIVQDTTGTGVIATGTSSGNGSLSVGFASSASTPLTPPLQPPLSILYNLLPVTCGKTVSNEVLGSGDATVAGQSFMLAKSPVTYLASGAIYISTIKLTINGAPWTEVASFYGQSATAQVFVTREDDQANTYVDFGDGVNGARLPTGTNNVVATYRVGSGAAMPPAGKLTVIAQAYPGLRSILNPVAVSGGSDADPPSLLQWAAPRSVLTFGRAVSIDDYAALAAQVAGVTLAQAVWSWNASTQRAGVTVYVAGAGDVVTLASAALAAAGDPNRPVTVKAAIPIDVTLIMTLIVTPGFDTGVIKASVQSALADPATGLFSPARLGIGQTLFDSQIEAACLQVSGVVAISAATFYAGMTVDPGPLHVPGEGRYYSLSAANVQPSTQVDPNGG
ncbi:MAG: baseplate J/gp47 family protein [Steroidobacteraceae bacterium]